MEAPKRTSSPRLYTKHGRPTAVLFEHLLAEQDRPPRNEAESKFGKAFRVIDRVFRPRRPTTRERDRAFPRAYHAEVGCRKLKRSILRGTSPKALDDRSLAEDRGQRAEYRETSAKWLAENDNRPRTRRPHSPRRVNPIFAARWRKAA